MICEQYCIYVGTKVFLKKKKLCVFLHVHVLWLDENKPIYIIF